MALTADEEDGLRDMLHRGLIRETLERYFHSIDAYDYAGLASCFTDDAAFEFNPAPGEKLLLTGGAAIAEFFRQRRGNFKAQCHFLNHAAITLAGGSASAMVYAMSNIIFEDRIAVRGLRYADRFARDAAGWRISQRVHTPLWQYNATPVTPFTASAQRRDG